MDRRRFLKVVGIGIIGLAVASFVKPDKLRDTPKTEEWMEEVKPLEPLVLRNDDIVRRDNVTLSQDSLYIAQPEYTVGRIESDRDLEIYTDDMKVSITKMAKRLKEIESKVFEGKIG